jgi:hypothetical protein
MNLNNIATFYPGGKNNIPVAPQQDQRKKGISLLAAPEPAQGFFIPAGGKTVPCRSLLPL